MNAFQRLPGGPSTSAGNSTKVFESGLYPAKHSSTLVSLSSSHEGAAGVSAVRPGSRWPPLSLIRSKRSHSSLPQTPPFQQPTSKPSSSDSLTPSTISMRFRTYSLRVLRRVRCLHGELLPLIPLFLALTDGRELILQRYTMTMNRVNALTSYLSRPPPIPAPSARTAADPGPSQRPVLSNYLVHPLQPLPLPTADGTDPINPIARDVLEFVMSTLPLPQISASEAELLSQPPWSSNEELRSMGPDELTRLRSTLVGRLQREGRRSQALKEEIRRQNEEYTWNLRIDDEADEEEEAGGPLEVEVIDVDAEPQKSEKVELKKDPQESWTLVDYMRFIDHGRLPDPS